MATVEQNPLVAGLERLPVHPTSLVIFGGTGDLAKRKLLPALYNLKASRLLPRQLGIIGVTRKEKSHEQFREEQSKDIREFATRPVDDVVTLVSAAAAESADLRNAESVETDDIFVALTKVYGRLFEEALEAHGTGRDEVLERLAVTAG